MVKAGISEEEVVHWHTDAVMHLWSTQMQVDGVSAVAGVIWMVGILQGAL